MSNESQACETPLEDLRAGALKHYDEVSSAAHSWHSVIPQAINFYFDRKQAEAEAQREPELITAEKGTSLREFIDKYGPATSQGTNWYKDLGDVLLEARSRPTVAPLDMLLFCPQCGEQHIDQEQELCGKAISSNLGSTCIRGKDHKGWCGATLPSDRWTNPPHKSHACQFCGCIWRPADLPTNGVAAIATKGKVDTHSARPRYYATAKDFNDATSPTVAEDGDGWLWNQLLECVEFIRNDDAHDTALRLVAALRAPARDAAPIPSENDSGIEAT